MLQKQILLSLLALSLALFACDRQKQAEQEQQSMKAKKELAAICVIHGTKGNKDVNGVVTFTQKEDHVLVHAKVNNLFPGKHGFHIHEIGDTNCPDGTCTGGHFAPEGNPHAGLDTEKRHVGDMGNIEAGEDGHVDHTHKNKKLSLKGKHSIIGRAVVIHAGEDDLTSQPSGDAGARVGVGVIGIAKNSMAAQPTAVQKAVCVLQGTEGNEDVSGVVTFTQQDENVLVEAEITGLAPGKHGFHVHQWGDVNCADGTCTGGHFNPFDKKHGAPTDEERHVGDMGNVVADENGKVSYSYEDSLISLKGEHSIVGRGIVVHAGEDDLTSQPTGAAGARVAVGVIGIAEVAAAEEE